MFFRKRGSERLFCIVWHGESTGKRHYENLCISFFYLRYIINGLSPFSCAQSCLSTIDGAHTIVSEHDDVQAAAFKGLPYGPKLEIDISDLLTHISNM